MTNPFGTPETLVQRDRWGRPLIKQLDGTTRGYTRCTTYVKALDETSALTKWKQNMTLLGAAKSEAIINAAKALTIADKRELAELSEQAMVLAGAGDKATAGTTLHKLSERLEAGDDLSHLDAATTRDLDAYRRIMAGFEIGGTEEFTVCDELDIAGTFDRELIVRKPTTVTFPGAEPVDVTGRRIIGDLKTGKVDNFTIGAQAMQLAVYAHSHRYNVTTGERAPLDVDLDVAVIVHLPVGSGQARLVWVDIAKGWQSVQLARSVRGWRKWAKFAELAVVGEAA